MQNIQRRRIGNRIWRDTPPKLHEKLFFKLRFAVRCNDRITLPSQNKPRGPRHDSSIRVEMGFRSRKKKLNPNLKTLQREPHEISRDEANAQEGDDE